MNPHISLSLVRLPSLGKRVDLELTLLSRLSKPWLRVHVKPRRSAVSDGPQSLHAVASLSDGSVACDVIVSNLPKALELLLDRDGLALSDICRGKSFTFFLPVRSARAPTKEPSPRRLQDYLLARATAADYVVPFLIKQPDELPLFPYQREGAAWLYNKERGILADDMGLGKTLQAIAALRHLFADFCIKSVLVVCPKSLLSNWESEIGKWAPEITYVRMVPSAAVSTSAWEAVIGYAHVLLTTYEQIRNPAPALTNQGVDLIVADEAHRVRNAASLAATGIKNVRAKRLWALTGTPIERDTYDLSTLMSIISPMSSSPTDAALSPAFVRSVARPFVLRRLKSQVLSELPPVVERREVLELGPKQARSYKRALDVFSKQMDDSQTLALINRLRQICDYDPDSKESIKGARIMEILGDIKVAGEKAILFSHFKEPLQLMRSMLSKKWGQSCLRLLTGDQDLEVRQAAVKDFKANASVSVLLASSRIAGEGLTLTEANHVIFFNEWWNPSANDQARDRVVRLGQTRGVMVYTFVCRNTVEELLVSILQSKRITFEDVVNTLAVTASSDSSNFKELGNRVRESLADYSP